MTRAMDTFMEDLLLSKGLSARLVVDNARTTRGHYFLHMSREFSNEEKPQLRRYHSAEEKRIEPRSTGGGLGFSDHGKGESRWSVSCNKGDLQLLTPTRPSGRKTLALPTDHRLTAYYTDASLAAASSVAVRSSSRRRHTRSTKMPVAA